jgi:aryl-alcohol dehydrogenase-like predicted oxidoreductase
MRYRSLGSSGLLVSVVGLGCNNFGSRLDAAAARNVIDAALDAGVTLLDTSDSYGGGGGSESAIGEALVGRRDSVVLATKFGSPVYDPFGPAGGRHAGRGWIRRAVEASLRRLRTDYLDLYQLHFPDPGTPLEETIAAMSELVTEGKVRYLGHSNLAGWQIARAAHLGKEIGATPFVSAQNEYSLLERNLEAEVVPACETYGLGVLPYFPLANGLLTGKVRRGRPAPEGTRIAARKGYVTDDKLDRVEALVSFAEERKISLLDVAIGGLAAQPAVASVIAGATSAEQVKANAAAGDWEPTADDLAALDELVPGPPREQVW